MVYLGCCSVRDTLLGDTLPGITRTAQPPCQPPASSSTVDKRRTASSGCRSDLRACAALATDRGPAPSPLYISTSFLTGTALRAPLVACMTTLHH